MKKNKKSIRRRSSSDTNWCGDDPTMLDLDDGRKNEARQIQEQPFRAWDAGVSNLRNEVSSDWSWTGLNKGLKWRQWRLIVAEACKLFVERETKTTKGKDRRRANYATLEPTHWYKISQEPIPQTGTTHGLDRSRTESKNDTTLSSIRRWTDYEEPNPNNAKHHG